MQVSPIDSLPSDCDIVPLSHSMHRPASDRLDVLHVTQPTTAGVAKVVQQFIADQCRRGLSVGLASPEHAEFISPLVALGCHYFRWEAVRSPFKGILAETRQLGQIIAKSQPKVVHLHSSKAGMIGRLLLRQRTPTVFQPNGWSFAAGQAWLKPFSKQFELFAAKHWTTVTVCVSDLEAQAIQQSVPSHQIEIIANGLDLNEWDRRSQNSKQQARQILGVPHDAQVAVCVGRVTKQKGPDLMLEVWKRNATKKPNQWLLWAGDGDMFDAMKSESGSMPQFRFDGPTKQPKIYFEAADVVVMPSRWEGHSLSMLEALATSRPVVAFDVEGMKETITSDIGAIVPRNDINAFAEALDRWLNESAENLMLAGNLARQRVEELYDLDLGCSRLIDLYQRMTAGAIELSARNVIDG